MAKAHHYSPQPSKTYATRANAIKAVEKAYGENCEHFGSADLHYVIMATAEGRYYPLFIGERALKFGAHFHFSVVA